MGVEGKAQGGSARVFGHFPAPFPMASRINGRLGHLAAMQPFAAHYSHHCRGANATLGLPLMVSGRVRITELPILSAANVI